MITIEQKTWREALYPSPDTVKQSQESQSSPILIKSVVVIYLMVMLILLPVQAFELPLNLALIDLWNLLALPIFCLYLLCMRQTVRLPYFLAILLIWLGSFISTLAAPNPLDSLSAILREIYLYIWFVVLAALFAGLEARSRHRIMLVWSSVVILHGALIIVQFLFPPIFQAMIAFARKFGELDQWRPSGLFKNANAAAFFQLMGSVPLMLVCSSRKAAMIAGVFLFCSILGTGSLGAAAAFLCGITIAVITSAVVSGRLGFIIKFFVLFAMAALLLGGLFYFIIVQHHDYAARFEYIFYGRAERSAEGRFGLWERGLDRVSSKVPLWGVGPDNFKEVDIRGTYVHNDLLAFLVERGLISVVGLLLFAVLAVRQAIRLLLIHNKDSNQAGLTVIVFLAAIIAGLAHSQTHQIFHDRSLWLVLAMQEAALMGNPGFPKSIGAVYTNAN